MCYLLGMILFSVQMVCLVKAEEILHINADKDVRDDTVFRNEISSQHHFDRKVYGAEQFGGKATNYDGFNNYENFYGDAYPSIKRDKYLKDNDKSDQQFINKFNKHHNTYPPYHNYKPRNRNDYQQNLPKSQNYPNYFTTAPRTLFLENSKGGHHNLAPSVENEPEQPSGKVPRRSPGFIGFLLELMNLLLESRRSKIQTRNGNNLPNIPIGDKITLDTISATQEVMLKVLEWGAFIATDFLFQLFWPE